MGPHGKRLLSPHLLVTVDVGADRKGLQLKGIEPNSFSFPSPGG